MMGNDNISSYVPCICSHSDYQSKYNYVETPRKSSSSLRIESFAMINDE